MSSDKEQDTYLNHLPKEWSILPLNHLVETRNGLWKGNKSPLINAKVIRNTNFNNDGTLDLLDVAELKVQSNQFETRQLEKGDIILERSGGGPTQPVGRVVYFNLDDSDYSFSNFTTRLRVVSISTVHSKFLLYYLLHFYKEGNTNALQSRTTGIRNLNFKDYCQINIPLPPLPEQRAIAHVLNTVRQSIEATERVIAAAKELKRSMMKYLFTYGPVPIDQADQVKLKETEIGEVPEGWLSGLLGDFITLQRGFDLPTSQRKKGNIPIVSSSGISGWHSCAKVSEPGVVTGRYGSIGKVHFVEQDYWPLNTTLFVKNFHGNFPKFVYYQLHTIKLESFNDKTSVPGVNRNQLHSIRLAYPNTEEQVEIASILTTTDRKILAELKWKLALETLFNTLLHHLMTGKTRVVVEDG
jgi:type I restriction enzyme, S subunit